MSNISAGTLATSGTSTFVVGTESGINTSVLIENAVQQKTIKADRIDIQIAENASKISALNELQTLAQSLQTSLEALRTPTGILQDDESAFRQKTAFLTASDTTDPSNLLGLSVDQTAETGQYEIEVTQEAKVQKVIGTAVADETADLNYTGAFTIGLSNGASVQVDVTSDMSLQELATAINDADAGVTATILKTSETDYQLVLTGDETNQTIQTALVSGDDVLNLVGVTDGAGSFNDILQDEQPAIIELDGVTITRDDNVFDDLIDGIEINIRNASPGTIISLEIESDASAVRTAIESFISSYNALRDFVIQNQEVSSDGEVSDDAILFSDLLLEGLSDDIAGILGDDFSSGSSLETIRDLGLAFDSDNHLIISDSAALDAALVNNLDEVENFFAASITSDNSQFALITSDSTLASASIVFDITVDGSGSITAVTANGDGSAFTINGTRLVGASGSIY
ncbi:MAG: flagellar filament capping protein FliD, partial [Bdellovibrionales bacterium]